MSNPLQYSLFAPLLGSQFDVRTPDPAAAPMPLRLVDATLANQSPRYEQFSLLWEGPPTLAQGTYRFSHPQTGELEIFIVPVGRTEDTMRYEAIFNVLRAGPGA